MSANEKCWLCLRITPKELARVIHDLPFEEPHKVLQEATRWIETAYKKYPTFFCGRTSSRIVGGLVYLLGFKHSVKEHAIMRHRKRITQRDIALSFSRRKTTTEHVIRDGFKDWIEIFPELDPLREEGEIKNGANS